ncbi:MAG: response regulator transcription factor [Acidobacteriota bacterium]
MPRALIVEDDRHIRELVALHLGLEDIESVEVADGREALDRLAAEPFDVVILDLMLPNVDGLTICRAVRRGGPNREVPILMLTARREESDKVLGLESGADDYLAKPFGTRELVARVRALLRRPRAGVAASPADQAVITIGRLTVDAARQQVRVDGRDVGLTAQEFRLVHLLASHPGIVYSRETLLERVWPEQTHVTPRSVDTLVKRVRKRIEDDPGNPRYLLTVWGTGYKFADA